MTPARFPESLSRSRAELRGYRASLCELRVATTSGGHHRDPLQSVWLWRSQGRGARVEGCKVWPLGVGRLTASPTTSADRLAADNDEPVSASAHEALTLIGDQSCDSRDQRSQVLDDHEHNCQSHYQHRGELE